ncbi:response regulator transcription factor [Ekhidna sp.]|jgi:two-component system copper resistance phosphate regulon response regulator CusR|uniref:response regulator transcription factor n=1 Tax=Ekhidna sp. TaxID=2608089 RepID=UPI0032EBCC86
MTKVLLVEDEPGVAAFIKKGLEEESYQVQVAYDGHLAIQLLSGNQYDLIILDLILPGMNGIEICKKIRSSSLTNAPILMLTALNSTENIITGLDSGADDYLPKPFKLKELHARLRALLRRSNKSENSSLRDVLEIEDLKLDRATKIAIRDNKEIKLTSTEYRLLEYLMKNQGRILSRVDILDNVWDINFDMGTNVVDVYINYLRNKIEKGFKSKLIHTAIGMGYIMRSEF